jgi:hypothetical protein
MLLSCHQNDIKNKWQMFWKGGTVQHFQIWFRRKLKGDLTRVMLATIQSEPFVFLSAV